MNKILKLVLVAIMGILVISTSAVAQGKSNKGKTEAKQSKQGPPPWAPAHGYRAKTRYVYFKDYDVYYDNDRGVYISLKAGSWTISAKLPSILTKIDLVTAVKVDLDFSGDDPQRDHGKHMAKYPKKKK